jgi:hypothetical protein
MATISFKPKQVTERLLLALPERSRHVLTSRYGLDDEKRMTLEAIGEEYGITRERVRQIENHALSMIRRSEVFSREEKTFAELAQTVHDLGGILPEEDLLDLLARTNELRNHIHLLLVLGDTFVKHKDDGDFYHRWHVNRTLAENVEESLRSLASELSHDDLIPDSEMVAKFADLTRKNVPEHYRDDEQVLRRWLGLSKRVGRNPLGEWGIATSPNVRVKGMRDYAYLAIRRHGSPMHFTEVARAITKLFGHKAHEATCHNELIKDNRFVLVGRGLYALSEWGYAGGVVKDVIRAILEKNGPLTRREIIEKVLKERYVKENTVVVNLENVKHFKRDGGGRYMVA